MAGGFSFLCQVGARRTRSEFLVVNYQSQSVSLFLARRHRRGAGASCHESSNLANVTCITPFDLRPYLPHYPYYRSILFLDVFQRG